MIALGPRTVPPIEGIPVAALKSYRIGRLFTRKNGDFGAISAAERSCAALVSKAHTKSKPV